MASSTKSYVMALAIMLDGHCSCPTQKAISWGPGTNWVCADSADIYGPRLEVRYWVSHKDSRMNQEWDGPWPPGAQSLVGMMDVTLLLTQLIS